MKFKLLLISFSIALLFTSCAQLRHSTTDPTFTRIYNHSSNRLFETTLASLQSEGFSIALADKQRGIIQTAPVEIDDQAALALFDQAHTAHQRETFSIRLNITPLSNEKSQLIVRLLSNQKSNSILEQTLLNNVAVRLEGDNRPLFSKIDVSKAPLVSILLKDNSTFEGYLLDNTQRAYLRLKLKSGGILHVERSDVERYTLTSESSVSERN